MSRPRATWAPACPPGLTLASRERGRPLPEPTWAPTSEGCRLLADPLEDWNLIWEMRASEPSLGTRTPVVPGKGGYLRGSARAGELVGPFTSLPRVGNVGRGAASSPRSPPNALPDLPPSPAPLPASAPYLEKERDLPPGQILLGIVGVHGCAARAWGAGREAPGMRRPGLGLKGSAPGTVQSPLSRANTRSALPSQPRGGWSPRSRHPHLGSGARTQAAGWEQRLPGFPGSAAARGGAEGVEEGGRRSGREAAARPPLPLSARRSAPPQPGPPLRSLRLRWRAGGGRRVRGWAPARALGARSHTPPGRPGYALT